MIAFFLLAFVFFTPEHKIHFIEKGTGQHHVILLHGFASNTYTWHNQVDPLVKEGYHVWSLDFLGFGKSDKPSTVSYSVDLYRSQVLTFMKSQKIERAHFVGHSMGGTVALAVALSSPECISSLTLIDPAAYPVKLPRVLSRYCGFLLRPFITESMVRFALSKLYYSSERLTEEQIAAYWRPFETKGAKGAAIEALNAIDNQFLEKQSIFYNRITVPTLLIWGENDRLTPLAHLVRLQKELPRREIVVIPHCGHIPQEEQPSLVNPPLLSFLARQH